MAEEHHNGWRSLTPDLLAAIRADSDRIHRTPGGYCTESFGEAMHPVGAAVRSFADFLALDDVHRAVALHQIGCLADALGYWLVRGDATQFCPTYEFYLRAVVDIIAIWNDEPGDEYENLDSRFHRVVPGGFRLDEQSNNLATRDWQVEREERVILPTLTRSGSEVAIWNHPALSKDTFEYVRLRRHAGRTAELTLD